MGLAEMKKLYAEKVSAAEAIQTAANEANRSLTEDEAKQIDGFLDEAADLETKIDAAMVAEARGERLQSATNRLASSSRVSAASLPGAHQIGSQGETRQPLIEVPASVHRYGTVRAFSGARQQSELSAYKFGMWALAINGHGRAAQFCRDNGVTMSIAGSDFAIDHVESVNTKGGFLVPEEFDNEIIRLVETYGVIRQIARISPMMSDTKARRRRTGGLTANFVGEGSAGSNSNKTWDRVNLVAKKIMAITTMSSELNEDSVINLGDDLAWEIGQAFATKEDSCGIDGDGTSTYGGITGLKAALVAATASLITGASGTAASWAGVTLANFHSMIGLLPQYAEAPETGWLCSKAFFSTVMQRLIYAAGGATTDALAGPTSRTFLGYPVTISQTMPTAAGTAEVVCAFGSGRQAIDFGDRRGMSIAFSTDATVNSESMFETDSIAVRGVERFDINVHDVGNTSVAGPMVGLLTAS
jgi:HK97 family phage major capsid protein